MIKKLMLFSLLAGFALWGGRTSQAATIHVRYFESADFVLTEERFQLYSFSALAGEEVTLVVYGLEDGLIPALSILDINGVTVAEDLNPNQLAVSVIELTASENGLYTALVSRQTDVGGLIRVMLFVGDPLETDISLLDTIDPLLPSRAYFAIGDSENPISMTVSVLDDEDDNTPLPQIFASRGTEIEPPPIEERVTAIDRFTWRNNNGDVFYTLNVRSLPEEQLPTSSKLGGYLSYTAQFLDLANIQLDIGQGMPNPDFLPRLQCFGQASAGTALLAGPGDQFIEVGRLSSRRELEIIGSSGEFWLVVDPESPTGGSFIPKSALQIISTPEQCTRTQFEFAGPDETADNTKPSGGSTGGGGNTTGGGFGLPPDGGNPSDSPNTPQDVVRLPPPNDPAGADYSGYPAGSCEFDGGSDHYDFGGGYTVVNPTTYSDGSCTAISGGALGNFIYAPVGYNPNELCSSAFPPATVALLIGGDIYECV